MTDRTLSAAELEALADHREVCFTNGIGWRIVLTTEECDALVAMARRTEAVERKLAKVEQVLETSDGGMRPTFGYQLYTDIRRALAED